MKRIAIMLLCAVLFAVGTAAPMMGSEQDPHTEPTAPDPDSLRAEAALLMDADTGTVLWEKNGSRSMQPASLTKILTGLIVLEELDPRETVTASAAAVRQPGSGTTAGIGAGEELRVDQALYAMMLRSANEAANILAEAVSGSTEAFVEEMNRRAWELGARDTRFDNPSGLPSRGERHRTTAYDLAVITRAAIQVPGFLDYFGAGSYRMEATNRSGPRGFTHTHAMLPAGSWRHNPEVIGGKTGYTTQAGHTLATVARRDGRTLICIVLDSGSHYEDTLALLEYGFGSFATHSFHIQDLGPIQVPVEEGGRVTGLYTLRYAGPRTVELLLGPGADPEQVQAAWVYPDLVEAGEEPRGAVTLRDPDPGEGLPGVLLRLDLQAEYRAVEPRPAPSPVPVPAAAGEREDARGGEGFLFCLALGLAGLGGSLALLRRSVRRSQDQLTA